MTDILDPNRESDLTEEGQIGLTMTELTPRQLLLEQISDKLCDAIQSDLENGVSSLNAKAAKLFKRNYPALNDVIEWVHNLYIEEMPND